MSNKENPWFVEKAKRSIIFTVLFYCFLIVLMNYFVIKYLISGELKDVKLLFVQIFILNVIVIILLFLDSPYDVFEGSENEGE